MSVKSDESSEQFVDGDVSGVWLAEVGEGWAAVWQSLSTSVDL